MDIQPRYLTIQTNTAATSTQSIASLLPSSGRVHIIPFIIPQPHASQHNNVQVTQFFQSTLKIIPSSSSEVNDNTHNNNNSSGTKTDQAQQQQQKTYATDKHLINTNINSNNSKQHQQYQNSLHGHHILGRHRVSQSMYQCYISMDNGNMDLCALKKVDQIIQWRKDHKWADAQGRIATINKYRQIQAVLHGCQI